MESLLSRKQKRLHLLWRRAWRWAGTNSRPASQATNLRSNINSGIKGQIKRGTHDIITPGACENCCTDTSFQCMPGAFSCVVVRDSCFFDPRSLSDFLSYASNICSVISHAFIDEVSVRFRCAFDTLSMRFQCLFCSVCWVFSRCLFGVLSVSALACSVPALSVLGPLCVCSCSVSAPALCLLLLRALCLLLLCVRPRSAFGLL